MNDLHDQPGTHIVAIGALVSPMWLHHLSDFSQEALPILGAGWIIFQAAVLAYTSIQKLRKPKA